MKLFAIAFGTIATAVAFAAPAQYRDYYGNRSYYYEPNVAGSDLAGYECWNPHARHFEGVRPGEVQNDLDFNRCRPMGGLAYRDRYAYGYGDRYAYGYGNRMLECWNPRAGHFEALREGEYQGDLDRSRCRYR